MFSESSIESEPRVNADTGADEDDHEACVRDKFAALPDGENPERPFHDDSGYVSTRNSSDSMNDTFDDADVTREIHDQEKQSCYDDGLMRLDFLDSTCSSKYWELEFTSSYPYPPFNSDPGEDVNQGSVGLQGDTSSDEAFGTPNQLNSSSKLDYSCFSDPKPSNSAEQGNNGESTTRADTESDSSEDTPSPSPQNDTWLNMAFAKHRIMVSLMKDVYKEIFSYWQPEFRSQTGSQAAHTGASSQNPSPGQSSSRKNGKRRREDRDSQSPDVNDEKERKKRKNYVCPKSGEVGQRRLFACFFFKYNAQRYCANHETGTKYRSCAGPGFSKISQLKQHLRRSHTAPIYCPRCWLVMESQNEMTLHVNAETRCEQREPQVLEGADPDKMRMITTTRAVSWEGIYQILFPGAPIPSPYYEIDDTSQEIPELPSPQFQEHRDFEVYSRTALPLLVEASLRATVESQIAPIEERVRVMVVDIVRTCQSTVERNFRLTQSTRPTANDRMQSTSQVLNPLDAAIHAREEPAETSTDQNTYNILDGLQYPSVEAGTASPIQIYGHSSRTGSQDSNLDSGYASLPNTFRCSCHDYSNSWNMANGRSNCQSCASVRFNFDDFVDFDSGDPTNDNLKGGDGRNER